MVAHETWRLASSPGVGDACEYIGSVQRIADLVAGAGDFASAQDFYALLEALHPSLEEVARSRAAAAPSDQEAVGRGPSWCIGDDHVV